MNSSQRVALITGVTGQDGSYLADLLLEKEYEVHGLIPEGRTLRNCDPRVRIHHGDLADLKEFPALLDQVAPHEVYNLGGQTQAPLSYALPVYTAEVMALGPLRILEAIRVHQEQSGRQVRFFQASSSEMFGRPPRSPQNEETPLAPRNPYAVSKVFAHLQTASYRDEYGLFACSGILFNHESPRRGEAFVTRKITRAAARIKRGLQQKVALGNLDAQRDWGFAGDFVLAMWLMLQQTEPEDYIIATGETHTVRDFLDEAFGSLDLDWRNHVEIDPRFVRPPQDFVIRGDVSKARRQLGWQPVLSFRELARLMTAADLRRVDAEFSSESPEDLKSQI